jgi:hypothetical protein
VFPIGIGAATIPVGVGPVFIALRERALELWQPSGRSEARIANRHANFALR